VGGCWKYTWALRRSRHPTAGLQTELAWSRERPAGSPRSDATHRGSQMRRDPRLLGVPQDLAKQPVLGDGLHGVPRLAERDKFWYRRQVPATRRRCLPGWRASQSTRAAVAWSVSATTRPRPQPIWSWTGARPSTPHGCRRAAGRTPHADGGGRRPAAAGWPGRALWPGSQRRARPAVAHTGQGRWFSCGDACCWEVCRLAASSGWPAWRTSWRRALHSSRSDAGDNPRPLWPPAVAR
jgi:hypothetical protein